MSKDTYYFSHDSNARNDIKILMIRATYGWQGYGIYWGLIEMMFESTDACLYHSRLMGIASHFHIEHEFLKDFVQSCIEEELFQSDGETFWSDSLRRRKQKIKDIKEKRSIAGKSGGRVRTERLQQAKKDGTHTKEQWEEMKKFFNYKCVMCSSAVVNDTPVKDHIVPIYQGGSDCITNIQPLCRTCNASKGPDTTDHRIIYCQANDKQMPGKWLAKSSKGKESKGKEIKLNNKNTFVATSDEVRLSELLFKEIQKNNPTAKEPNIQSWAKNIDLMIRVDKRTPEQIEQIIKFAQTDTFWQANILSTKKLREKFDQLWMKQKPKQEAGGYFMQKAMEGRKND